MTATRYEIRRIIPDGRREFNSGFKDIQSARERLESLRAYWEGQDYIKFELVEITERIVEV